MRVALHARLRPDKVDEYEAAHRAVPAELVAAFRRLGVTSWTIWRSGVDLFHLLECEDHARLRAGLAGLPVNLDWQVTMTRLLEVPPDHSPNNGAPGLPVVWEL